MNKRSFFLALLGLLFIFVEPSTTVYTDNIKVYNEAIVVDAGSRLLIPCGFFTNRHFRSHSIALEWDMMPEEGGDYKQVLMVFNTNAEPLQQPNERAHAFIKQLRRGNCSLAIDSTRVVDSGTYQVHLFFQGQQFSPFKTVKVHVRDCHHTSGASDPLCDEMDNTSKYIIAGGVAGGVVVASVLVFIGVLIFRHKKKTQHESGDIEEGQDRESPIEAYNIAQKIVLEEETQGGEVSLSSDTPPLSEHLLPNLFALTPSHSFSTYCTVVYPLPGYSRIASNQHLSL